jgi:hypothetical protein
MSGRDRLPVNFFITWSKLLSARANFLFLSGFMFFLAFLWIKDSYSLCLKAFLYLCPFLSLFFSQDMLNDEIYSGALESVSFIGGGFRSYLMVKNAMVAAFALSINLVLFSGLALYGLATRQLGVPALGQFAAGVLVGVYYVTAAGFLSFYFRAGANVLIIILGQALLFVGLLFTAAQRGGLVERLTASSFPGFGAKLEFLAALSVFPNLAIGRRTWLSILGLGTMTALLFSLEVWKIKALELRRR